MKKKNRFLTMKRRLEDAMFDSPAASGNEATGFSRTIPETDDEAYERARLANAVPSPPEKEKPYGKR